MRSVPMLCGLGVLASWSVAITAGESSKQSVQLVKQSGDKIEVTIGGAPFATFNYSQDLPKPFFSPVRGPDGTVISRPILKPGEKGDHPHHKGIWLAVDEVNGVDFWAEKGRIANQSVKPGRIAGGPASMVVTNHWLDAEDQPVVTEKTTIRIYPNRVVEYDVMFVAEHGPVHFGDTKEGLFGFRMVDSMREREGGHVVASTGAEGSKAAWGKPAKWIDYYGPVDGKTFGVAIFDHPDNFRPSRYHVRDYGLFSVNPFGEKAYAQQEANEAKLEKGESLRLRYALYVHAGDTQQADVAETYRAWLAATK